MAIPFPPLRVAALVVGAALLVWFSTRLSIGGERDSDGPRPAEQHRFFHNGSVWTPLVWGAPDGGLYPQRQFASPNVHRYWFGAPYLMTVIDPAPGSYLARAYNLKEGQILYRYHVPPGYEQWGGNYGVAFAPREGGPAYGPDVYPESEAVIIGTPQHPQYSGEVVGVRRETARVEGRRVSSTRDIAAATRLISLGDEKFAQGEFSLALRHYRRAADAAPDLATAYFRQGLAYVASNRADFSAAAFRRGLRLDPQWPEARFDLARLCGPAAEKFNEHTETMRVTAESRRADSDAYFTLGIIHYLRKQDDAARSYFDAVYHLGGKNAQFLDGFPAGSRGRAAPVAEGG